MKTKLFFSIVILLQLILISCNEKLDETNVTSNKKDNKLLSINNPYDSFGIIHNELLDFHYTSMLPHKDYHMENVISYNNQYYVKAGQVDTLLISMKNYSLNRGYSINSIDSARNQIYSFLNNTQMLTTINGTYVIKDIQANIYTLINGAMTYGNLSQKEYNVLSNIISCYYNKNYGLIPNYINSINLNNYDIDDYPAVYAFIALYNHSYDYWNNYYSEIDKKANKNDDEIQTTAEASVASAFADAIGLVIGVATGAASLGPYTPIYAYAFSQLFTAVANYVERRECTCPVCQYWGMCE